MTYFVVDIETAPIDMHSYDILDEEERRKLINPIDSRIISIGIRFLGANYIIRDDEEEALLTRFWEKWKKLASDYPGIQVVGFNIAQFDLPFITTRSFIHNVQIVPFVIKSIVDLRDKVTAYRYGHNRGTLKDFAKIMGFSPAEITGSEVARFYKQQNWKALDKYLIQDLQITDEMYHRIKRTNILYVNKW